MHLLSLLKLATSTQIIIPVIVQIIADARYQDLVLNISDPLVHPMLLVQLLLR